MHQLPAAAPVGDRPAPTRHRWLGALAALWLCGAVGGLYVVWAYDNAPGESANPPGRWPVGSTLTLAVETPTLVLLAHPQCSCTRASLGELAEVLARARTRPKTYVVFLKPSEFGAGWEQTDLWRTAASLPGVTVVRDVDGLEARRFSAATSGQALLYDTHGALLFTGGITGARAHQGDNRGRATLVDLLNGRDTDRTPTSVFGCPLFADGAPARSAGRDAATRN